MREFTLVHLDESRSAPPPGGCQLVGCSVCSDAAVENFLEKRTVFKRTFEDVLRVTTATMWCVPAVRSKHEQRIRERAVANGAQTCWARGATPPTSNWSEIRELYCYAALALDSHEPNIKSGKWWWAAMAPCLWCKKKRCRPICTAAGWLKK